MEKKYLKKVLAGFSIAGLMTGVGLIAPGPAAAG
jgi:radical SAM modification target selenobiotic family peptide